jgi:hypothetical protein
MRSIASSGTFRFIVLLLTTALKGWCTTAAIAVTPAGIVMGTDSKFTNRDVTYRSIGEGVHDKFLIVQNRIVVVNVGASNAIFRGVERYDFLTWMNNLQSRVPSNVTVEALAELIETESSKVFAFIPDMIKSEDIKPHTPDEFFRMFAQYLIIGYDSGTPKLYLIEFDLDWDRNILVGPKFVSLDPSSQPGNFHIYFYGFKEALADLSNPKSYAYEQTMLRCPMAFADLVFNRRLVPLDETATIVSAFISIEKHINPSDVGGDVRIVIIRPDGRALEKIKRPTMAKAKPRKPER